MDTFPTLEGGDNSGISTLDDIGGSGTGVVVSDATKLVECSGAMAWLNPFCGGSPDGNPMPHLPDAPNLPFIPFAKRVGVFIVAVVFIAASLYMLA